MEIAIALIGIVIAIITAFYFTDQGVEYRRKIKNLLSQKALPIPFSNALTTLNILSMRKSLPGSSPPHLRLTAGKTEPFYLGDHSVFIRDVTISDGSRVKAGRKMIKAWEIQNAGTVVWANRFLERQGPHDNPRRIQSPARVPVPYTLPGHRCLLEVEVVMPQPLGSYHANWKMVDENGVQMFPNFTGIWMEVDVYSK